MDTKLVKTCDFVCQHKNLGQLSNPDRGQPNTGVRLIAT